MYQFIPDNPTLTWREAGVKGPYSWFTLPTGAISGIVLIPIMVITSLPVLRRINYNTFYYIHVVFATAVIVLVSLHASTSFYFLLPGLILWLADWAWRVRNALGRKVEVRVQNAGNGWYRITLPAKEAELEKGDSAALTEATPDLLSTYYVNMPSVSRLQIHPFTAAAVGHGSSPPVLLFQKGPERKKAKQRDREWTWKLGALVDVNKEEAAPIPVSTLPPSYVSRASLTSTPGPHRRPLHPQSPRAPRRRPHSRRRRRHGNHRCPLHRQLVGGEIQLPTLPNQILPLSLEYPRPRHRASGRGAAAPGADARGA